VVSGAPVTTSSACEEIDRGEKGALDVAAASFCFNPLRWQRVERGGDVIWHGLGG
jgi:hypothetical protein